MLLLSDTTLVRCGQLWARQRPIHLDSFWGHLLLLTASLLLFCQLDLLLLF